MQEASERPDLMRLSLLDNIMTSRRLMRELIALATDYPVRSEQYYDFARHEQDSIKRDVQSLVELKRRRAKEVPVENLRIAKREADQLAELEARRN